VSNPGPSRTPFGTRYQAALRPAYQTVSNSEPSRTPFGTRYQAALRPAIKLCRTRNLPDLHSGRATRLRYAPYFAVTDPKSFNWVFRSEGKLTERRGQVKRCASYLDFGYRLPEHVRQYRAGAHGDLWILTIF